MNMKKNSARFRSGIYSLYIILIVTAIGLITDDSVIAQQETQPLAINLDELEWGPPGGGDRSPLGLRTARLGVDPNTGGVTYYAMFPAGTHFDMHWHSHDEYVSVMQGSVILVLGGERYELKAGAYVTIPARMNHSWTMYDYESVIILVKRAGPADFNYIEQ